MLDHLDSRVVTCLMFLIKLLLLSVQDSCRQFLALKVLLGIIVILVLLRTTLVSLVDARVIPLWTSWFNILWMSGQVQNVFLGIG